MMILSGCGQVAALFSSGLPRLAFGGLGSFSTRVLFAKPEECEHLEAITRLAG
jgi:hypothetical protein